MTILLTHEVMGEEHDHEFPDDWQFGGPDNCDPRADPRWFPSVYRYFGTDTQLITVTCVPICDEEALDYFTRIARIQGADPRWVQVKRPGGEETMLPFLYYKDRDEVVER